MRGSEPSKVSGSHTFIHAEEVPQSDLLALARSWMVQVSARTGLTSSSGIDGDGSQLGSESGRGMLQELGGDGGGLSSLLKRFVRDASSTQTYFFLPASW